MIVASVERVKLRFLTEESNVWSQNAWDHVPPPDDQVETIATSLAKQRLAPVPDVDKPKYNEKPARHWCAIYLPKYLGDADLWIF